ncbi:hypothetical protein [Flavobacterium sp.]|uniref:hypothetical protein n=1 Tax=Flavobacterium sp. TaxID=239 RepID=UPI0040489EB7
MQKLNLSVPKPCHENWNEMLSEEKGRFCQSCSKTVLDFTGKSNDEIIALFENNKTEKVCGRFRKDQLESIKIEIPEVLLFSQTSFRKSFLLALFVVMGTTLFSCKDFNNNVHTLGEVVVIEDSISNNIDTIYNKKIVADSAIKQCKTIKNEKLSIPPPPEIPELIEEPEIMGEIIMGIPIMPVNED